MAPAILLLYVCPPSGEKRTINEEIYSEAMIPQFHCDNAIKMDSNPSYGSYTGQKSNVVIHPNPSYGVNKPITVNQYDYVQSTEHLSHEDRDDVKMEPNPSYEVIRGEGGNMGCVVTIEPNPSYGVLRGEGNSNMGCDVTIEPNPSYGVTTRMGADTKTTAGSDVTITPNPAYDCVNAKK